MKPLNYIRRGMLLCAVLFAAGLCGCSLLHDDLSVCDLFLQFRYDYNMDGRDLFIEQVEEVKVFVFGADGKYIQTLTAAVGGLKSEGYRLRVPYSLKGCTAVVWAGETARFYSLPAMDKGNPLESLAMRYEPEGGRSDAHLDALWHSGPVRMTFPEDGGRLQTLSLVRNTNDVSVSLTRNGSSAGMADFDIVIEGANGSYDYRNEIMDSTRTISYYPCAERCTADAAVFHTLRFVEGTNMRLSVQETPSGKSVDLGGEPALDLVDYLLKTKPGDMNEQEYLDRRYEWDVDIVLDNTVEGGYTALNITINGWTYWFTPTHL